MALANDMYVFLGEFQFRLNSEESRVNRRRWEAMQCSDRIDAFLTEPIKDAICEDCLKVKVKVKVRARLNRFRFALGRKVHHL